MSAEDSLPEGYKYCNCHPETCTHFDGIMWVGQIEDKSEKLYTEKEVHKMLCDFNDEMAENVHHFMPALQEELDEWFNYKKK